MGPLVTYRYLTLAREKLFDWLRPLSEEQYRREFLFGMKRLSATLPHMMMAEWAYAWRMEKGTRVEWDKGPMPRDAEPAFADLERHWRAQAERTKAVIESVRAHGAWETIVESRMPFEGKTMVIKASPADFFMQLLCHEVHHRAQAMAMLRMMDVPAQDLDYSLMMYITWE